MSRGLKAHECGVVELANTPSCPEGEGMRNHLLGSSNLPPTANK